MLTGIQETGIGSEKIRLVVQAVRFGRWLCYARITVSVMVQQPLGRGDQFLILGIPDCFDPGTVRKRGEVCHQLPQAQFGGLFTEFGQEAQEFIACRRHGKVSPMVGKCPTRVVNISFRMPPH